jgi:hypothetical protein
MKITTYLQLGTILTFFPIATISQAADPSPPNLLFAIADDWGAHAGAYGTTWVKTPGFDRIAKEGVLFTRAYTPVAKCAPSRAIVLTGRHAWQLEEAGNHLSVFPHKFKSWPEVLMEQGWHMGITGKGWSRAFAIGFPSAESLNTIYNTYLSGHLKNFDADVQEQGKKVVQAALMNHKKVAGTFRKTAFNFHYEFNIRHMAGVFQGMLMSKPEQIKDSLRLVQLWLHESERVYCDRLVNLMDQKKYKECAIEQAKKYFKEMSPTALTPEPLIFCHFAQGVGDKIYDPGQLLYTNDLYGGVYGYYAPAPSLGPAPTVATYSTPAPAGPSMPPMQGPSQGGPAPSGPPQASQQEVAKWNAVGQVGSALASMTGMIAGSIISNRGAQKLAEQQAKYENFKRIARSWGHD